MELNYTPAAEGNAALATGIIGTGLGAMNLIGNLANGAGLFGMQAKQGGAIGCCSTNGFDHPVNRYELQEEMKYQKELMAKDMRIAELQSEKISDQKDIEVYKQLRSEIVALKNGIDSQIATINANLGAQAVQNQANKDSFQIMQERLDTASANLGGAIAREVATRKANDNLIITYTNSTFTPKVVMTTTFSDATVGSSSATQQTYNPLPCCDCND